METASLNEMIAAHRHLPLVFKVTVENRTTGEQVEVKITDRGPYADPKRRIIDLSKAAADSIGLVEQGVGPVRVVITEEAAKQKRVPRSRSSMSRWEPLNTRPTPRPCWRRCRTASPSVHDPTPRSRRSVLSGPDRPLHRQHAAQRIARGLTHAEAPRVPR